MLEADDGELTVLETNVIPGLTETSLLPQAADAAGIDFDTLVSADPGQRVHALSRRLGIPCREILGRDLVEELLELLDDVLGLLDVVLELDRGLGDDLLGGEDRGAGSARRARSRRWDASRSPARGRSR